ncbi:hypothetical protein AAG570_006734 [Ranatra chinensis]|uniref:Uncharacterized protein n=1 Tax=Ranatra chinensis TaxID=642074 RepID=A0ABD0YUY2_9HEMI
MPENSLDELCNLIIGDALLLSMFRVEATPVVCPFKSPPFSVIYSRGYGDCKQPPSRADSCTDDTRLVLRYQACPDVSGSEASVEELECLATWRDSSINYLVGRLHHKMATTDEEMYRCFVYEKHDQRYLVAQSGEATCSGMTSALEGSRVIRLTRVETQHTRCKFPSWVTQHYHWHSLDFRHNYHFSHRNASLRISSGTNEVETKLVCHTVVSENSHLAKLVVHVVSGCDGGYKCMTILKRDAHVIQMYHSTLVAHFIRM